MHLLGTRTTGSVAGADPLTLSCVPRPVARADKASSNAFARRDVSDAATDQMQPLNQTPHTLAPPQTLNGLVSIEALIPKMWLQSDQPQLQPPR